MGKMLALFVLGTVLAGTMNYASAARQLQQVLPALAGTPTWAPAATYSNMRIMAPLPTTTPNLGPSGIAMPNLTPLLGVVSSASNMRLAGAPAPVISLPPGITAAAAAAAASAPRRTATEQELERPRFVDTTKMVVGDGGIKAAGTGLGASAGASTAVPKPSVPSIRTAPGSGTTAPLSRPSNAPYSQALPAIPNLPVKPPTLIFDGMLPTPAQRYQWPTMQQTQQRAAGQTVGQVTQKAAQMMQQQLSNPAEQLQRLATAASEGNLARFIEDAGKMVSNNIHNVTAAANSLLAATNNILESLPRNLTIPGELGKLINSTTLQLPKLPTLNPAQVPSMARLAGSMQLPGVPQLPSFSSLFPGVPSLQLPRLPGLGSGTFNVFNPATAAGAAAARSAAAAAAVPAPTYYAQDVSGVAAQNSNVNRHAQAQYKTTTSGEPSVLADVAAPQPMSDVERRARAAAQKAQVAVAEATGAALPTHNAAALSAASNDAAAPAHSAAQQAAAARRAAAASSAAARAAQQEQRRQARSARASETLQSGGGFRVVDGQVVPAAH
ncbi:hypothetical protein COO60DRAFT_1113776 [Scenedesmus sp. NREL 46B-D3]|nr:hypothetical protein COO60DRAFT_1113776 [Scenedesmus sp. NREL 46B-D3]